MRLSRVLVLTLILAASAVSAAPVGDGARARTQAAAAPQAAETLYVDVRTPEEFAAGRVKGAINIPFDQMATRWREIGAHRDKQVVVYCRSGRRSAVAAQVLREQGFDRLRDAGTLGRLQGEGLQVVR